MIIGIQPPGPWQYYVTRKDNQGLPINEVRRKYLAEQLQFDNFVASQQATLQGMANGGGAAVVSVASYISDFSAGVDGFIAHPTLGGNVTLTAPETVDSVDDSLLMTTDGGVQNYIRKPDYNAVIGTTYNVSVDIYAHQLTGITYNFIFGNVTNAITPTTATTWETKTFSLTATTTGVIVVVPSGTSFSAGALYALKNISITKA